MSKSFLRTAVVSILKRVGKKLEDRIFYAVFQVTRVTNDAYGWDPQQEASQKETSPEASEAKDG